MEEGFKDNILPDLQVHPGTSRYIPVQGQKQYCDLIRKLSGADSKDAKVEKQKSLFSFVGSFTTNQVWPGTRLPGGDNIRQGERCDYGETSPYLVDCLTQLVC